MTAEGDRSALRLGKEVSPIARAAIGRGWPKDNNRNASESATGQDELRPETVEPANGSSFDEAQDDPEPVEESTRGEIELGGEWRCSCALDDGSLDMRYVIAWLLGVPFSVIVLWSSGTRPAASRSPVDGHHSLPLP